MSFINQITIPQPQLSQIERQQRQRKPLSLAGQPLQHAFLFLQSLDEPLLHAARQAMERLSDSVIYLGGGVFYGSLVHTMQWFRDKTHFFSEISLPSNSRMVVSPSLIHGFFYGSLRQGLGVACLDGDSLLIQRFAREINWSQWIQASLALVNLLQLPVAHRDKWRRSIGDFVAAMQHLGYTTPAIVPRDFSQAELTRRFGVGLATIWKTWNQTTQRDATSHPLPKLRPCRLRPSLRDFRVHAHALCPANARIALSEILPLARDLVFAALPALQNLGATGQRVSLVRFSISIDYPSPVQVSRVFEFKIPLSEKTPASERVVETLLSSLQQPEDLQKSVSEENDVHYQYQPAWAENITLEPLMIAIESPLEVGIFAHSSGIPSLAEVSQRVASRDNATIQCYSLTPAWTPDKCFVQAGTPKSPAQACLFRFAHRYRPLTLFRNARKAEAEHLFQGSARLVFVECIHDHEYFIVNNDGYALWVRSSLEQRQLPIRKRQYEILGYFDAPFAIPEA